MNNGFQVLVDSDAFVGWMYPNDTHHEQSKHIFNFLEKEKKLIVTTSLVINETATVLSHRRGQALARVFLELMKTANFPVIHISEDLQEEALQIFKKQHARGTSVTDGANVAVIWRFNIPAILSFDKIYRKSFGLKTVEGYKN